MNAINATSPIDEKPIDFADLITNIHKNMEERQSAAITASTPKRKTDLPVISDTTVTIFGQLNSRTPVKALNYPLELKAISAKDLAERWKDAKDHSTRNKIFAVLKAILHVSILVGGILGTAALSIACPPAAIVLALVTFLVCVGLGCAYADQAGKDPLKGPMSMLIASLVGSYYPILDAFTKEENLEAEYIKCEKEVANVVKKLKNYFSKETVSIKEELEKESQMLSSSINDLKESLTAIEERRVLKQKLEHLERATRELGILSNYNYDESPKNNVKV